MPIALKDWLKSKPGPFVGRTHDAVWETAWRNFCAGPTGRLTNDLMFSVYLQQAGYGIRSLAVGGYALDRVT